VLFFGEGVARFAAKVEVDAAYREVHRRQAPGGGVGFLPEHGDIAQLAAVGFDEFFGLHKHAAGAAARVVHFAVMRGEHGDQRIDDAGGRVELAAALAFGAGEHAQKIFVHLPQHIARLAGIVAEADGGDEINQLAQLAIRQRCAAEAFVEDV